MYTTAPTRESAPEGPNLIVGGGGVTEDRQRVEQVPLLPLGSLPHLQRHSTAGAYPALVNT